jgi:hypothetical protein
MEAEKLFEKNKEKFLHDMELKYNQKIIDAHQVYSWRLSKEDFLNATRWIPITLKTKTLNITDTVFERFYANVPYFTCAILTANYPVVEGWLEKFPQKCFQSVFIRINHRKVSVFDYFIETPKIFMNPLIQSIQHALVWNSFQHNGMHMTKNILIGMGRVRFWNDKFEFFYHETTLKWPLFFHLPQKK